MPYRLSSRKSMAYYSFDKILKNYKHIYISIKDYIIKQLKKSTNSKRILTQKHLIIYIF